MLIAVGRLNGSIRNQRLFYSSYELQTKIVKAQHYKQLETVNRHGMPQENMLRHLSVYWDLNLSCNISRPCSSHSWGHNHRLWCNCSSTLAVLVSLPAPGRITQIIIISLPAPHFNWKGDKDSLSASHPCFSCSTYYLVSPISINLWTEWNGILLLEATNLLKVVDSLWGQKTNWGATLFIAVSCVHGIE